nr:XdhC/CoxI family protein [Rhodoplanes tepidamans]
MIREREEGRPCALATIVNVVGSIPSYASAKMLVRENGTIVGTVGGGPAEAEVIVAAREVIATGRPQMLSFRLHDNPEMDSGMVCGGSLDVFVEAIRPAPILYLFGAGHVGVVTARAARLAGLEVVVVDDRTEFASAERFPNAQAIHVGEFEAVMARLSPNRRSLIFIATRCHEIDGRVLRWAVATPAEYVGMIGSRRKVATVFERLVAEGLPPEQLERVHAPVGLDIGADTPEEIAISVVAEMVAHIRGAAAARPLMRNMTGPVDRVVRKTPASGSGKDRTAA